MTVSEFIRRYGAEAGPEGIALFAYLKDNPSATCADAAKAIGMGKAALVRHALRLEGLGLVRRTVDKNENGLILPATLSIADPIQNSKGASDNTPSKIDRVSKLEPLPNQHPYQNGDVDSKEVNLSDPIQNSKGALGTEVAPSKDIRTSTDTTEKQGGAVAPNAPQDEFTVLSYLQHLATTPAFNHIDPVVEASKIEIWRARPPNQKRRINQRFILNWVNRIERPLEGNGHAVTSENRNGTRPGKEKLTDHARRTAEYFGWGGKAQGAG